MIASILLLAAANAATLTADRVAVDNVTKAAVATGKVKAQCGKVTVRSERMERDAEGVMRFDSSTMVTTCSNEVGHTHWNVTGEVEYQDKSHVIVRDAWLTMWEIPVLWLPYLYYPLDTKCGFSWMPGYTSRWGAFLMTKYRYHILGDAEHGEDTWWLTGDTRFDLRYKNGVAMGEDLFWNLNGLGRGWFKSYYAWDDNADHRYNGHVGRDGWDPKRWGSEVKQDRWAFELGHSWDPTEQDTVRVQGGIYSDSYFREDFLRRSFFNYKNQYTGYKTSGVFWEHVENTVAVGAEASGRLNDFYGSTERLPELYLDLEPQPVFELPFNYESENHAGWLRRRFADYYAGRDSVFGTFPGLWAHYETFRFDTYHRITAPFRTFDDVMSVVPRIGYHGTFWNRGGLTDTTGAGYAQASEDPIYRSIIEGGVTFAARGSGEVNQLWRHTLEPYFDVLAQEAAYSGLGRGGRPYVFDAIDASRSWEDQYAGRGRNLPYSYYGVTPGLRNAWSKTDEKGNSREILDFDVYAAVQFNTPHWNDAPAGLDNSSHRLAEPGDPNYGKKGGWVMPGARARWKPDEDISLGLRGEYDSDRNRMALGEVDWRHTLTKDFRYYADYSVRDSRMWDFSSVPFDSALLSEDGLNWAKYHYLEVGFTYQPLDWFAMSPYVRWDLRDGSLDTVGAWFDYLTDCLGFRFIVEYEDSYRRIDGAEYEHDWDFGFQIYLRAFGFDGNSVFGK